jgi:hypothetical protein
MSNTQNFLRAFAFILSLFVFSTVAFAQTETRLTQFSLYGMQSVASGQSLQVSVLNPRVSDGEIVPCIKVRIIFDVYAADGTTGKLRFVRRISHEVELEGGEAATVDYAASRSGDFVSPMVFARPEDEDLPEPVREAILPTLLLREGGRAILNLPAVIKGFDPQPDPPQSISAAKPINALPVPQ